MLSSYRTDRSLLSEYEEESVLAPASQRRMARLLASAESLERRFDYRFVKRVIDTILIASAAPVLIPFAAIVALLIRCTSAGPVFYTQRRINATHGTFPVLKYRTMCEDAAERLQDYLDKNPAARSEWLKTHKLKYDPRITAVGAFLRRTSIDELPQLVNVLLGHMSLVGPRPIVSEEIVHYGEYFEFYCRVKPGLTGLWQVSGRSHTTYRERVDLDCEYVRRWSVLLDIKILWRTIAAVLTHGNAY